VVANAAARPGFFIGETTTMDIRLEDYGVLALPCDRIYYDSSFNCRGPFTLQSISDLTDSIQQIGRILAPIWVQPAVDVIGVPSGYDYRLIAGHRRYQAVATLLKWPKIPATVVLGLTERQARLINLTENLERKDLNPLEEALAIKNIPWPDGMTIRNVARELKRDTRWVHARLRLLDLPDEVQQMTAARRVSLLDLEVICRKQTPQEQIKAAEAIAASKRGRGKKAFFVGENLSRSFRRRRNKTEINRMIAKMLDASITGLAPRALAWCAGHITEEELQTEFVVTSAVARSQ
jgi:ParB family transcriptional regulator, chromosome partitioning protein